MDLNEKNENILPNGWVLSCFGDVADYINGRAFKPSDWDKKGRPIIRIQNLTGSTNKINRYSRQIEDKYIIKNGEILISWSATLDAFIYNGEEAVLNQHIFKVKPYINKKFLYYLTKFFINEIKQKVHGSGMQHITKNKFEETFIPLPPLPEQHRIVAKIEELFTKLDAGVEALKKIKKQIKQYRQAVLKYAFEGKLTEEWRIANAGKLEPASVLLEKIKKERKKQQGKKYKELLPVDKSKLPGLPEAWIWTRVGEIYEIVLGQSPPSSTYNSEKIGLPFYQGKAEFGEMYPSPIKWCSKPKKIAEKGDVLISVRAPVGPTNICPEKSCIGRGLVAIRPLGGMKSSFILYLMRNFEQKLAGKGTGTTFKAITGDRLKEFLIPLPPLLEQQKIVEEIERRFSVADNIEKIVDENLKQAERLRQSILKKAFEGKLVPQDPNDEPASVLLQKIKAEKKKLEEEKKVSKKKKGERGVQ